MMSWLGKQIGRRRSVPGSLLHCCMLLALAASARARAQTAADGWAPPEVSTRPTSGAPSLSSGRTLGESEALLAAGAGWPGVWAGFEYGITPTISLGARLAADYGSPVMGLTVAGAGVLSLPLRIHVFGEGSTDLALRVAPTLAVGEGRAFGEESSPRLSSDVGGSAHLELGARLGYRITDAVTLVFGLDVAGGFSLIDPDPIRPFGLFLADVGVEGLVTPDLMLFADIGAGIGVAEERSGVPLYPRREILRVSLGIAVLL